ncbi:hypothetical protein OG607_05405 [Streptomyces sp. NBC_01537]|uniref:hypothetical protein n=1 Tax=Streptomyces sp. NBC_01537 TaxID=2903896 RepID=UPI003864D75F
MRLLDLLHPHLGGVTEVVDTTGGGIALEPYLQLPEGTALRRADDTTVIGEGALALLSYGPDPERHDGLDACLAALGRLRTGGRGLILFGYRAHLLPWHRLMDALVAHRCQPLRAGGLDYVHLHGGMAFTCTEQLLPLHDGDGRPAPGQDGTSTALRIAGEYVLADFVSRSQRARLLDLEREREADARALETLRQNSGARQAAEVLRERDRLAADLRAARERIDLLETRVTMLQGSTSLRVGQVLIGAARSPLRGSARLPGELYGMWRGRRRGPVTAPPGAAGPGREEAAEGDARLHLAHRAFTAGPRDRLVIAGVLDARTARDFAVDAAVSRLLPHDARIVTERTDPDAVVVQLSACIAAASGPWAHTGTGAAPDLDRRLAEVLATARALGRRTVLWRDAPVSAAPGLARLPWDAFLDGDTGVRPGRPEHAAMDPAGLRELFTTRATRVRLSELARIAGAPDPLDARRVAVLADPRGPDGTALLIKQVLAQLHPPVEVLVPRPGPAFEELTASGIAVRASADGPTAPWVSDWTADPDQDRPAAYLLDLMCAQECSGAAQPGLVPKEALR